MNSGPQKNEVFGDYAAFLNTLLPEAQGFIFHDRHGSLFWHDKSPDTSQLNDAFHTTLERTNSIGELPHNQGRVQLESTTAYLMQVCSDQGRTLGVLTALVNKDMGGMPWQFCCDLLQPAIRSLQRELSLRFHLLEANKKLTRHDGEYEFLRKISEKSHEQNNCNDTIGGILELCLEHLQLDGARFLAPERNLNISVGSKPIALLEAELIYESMQDIALENPDNAADALNNRPEADEHQRARSWPIIEDGNRLTGILVLSRPASVEKLNEHSISLAGFVVSAAQYILERGFDSLTGLTNWPGFEPALEQACADNAGEHTVLYCNIDQLHVINDTIGRDAGDDILRNFAGILRNILDDQVITRISADSFSALLVNCSIEQAETFANDACQQIREIHCSNGVSSFKPSVSIGVAPLAPNADNIRNALVPAEVACQAAKDRGRGRVEIYQSSDTSIIRRMDEISIVGSIKSAIEAGRLILFAQPIVRVDGAGPTNYYELLVRLLDSAGEPLPPAEFMTAAERYQLMEEIDRWVVTKAVDTLADLAVSLENRSMRFAVNLSGQSIGNDKFLEFVRSELTRSRIAPDRLCFEITETVAVTNIQKAQLFMSELKKMGCQFSLDDFGTGLSSFAYLKLFPVDKIKIDGSFVHDICENEVSHAMVSAISDIARVMKIETVAEYVQSKETMAALNEIGVDWAQGFYLAEPARLSDLFENAQINDTAIIADVDTAILTTLPDELAFSG